MATKSPKRGVISPTIDPPEHSVILQPRTDLSSDGVILKSTTDSPEDGVILPLTADSPEHSVTESSTTDGPKRGAIPSPRHALAAAEPHVALSAAPPNSIVIPQNLSMWGNDAYGDCVTAEEAFAKACNNPEIFISYDDAVAWATRHGVLHGATLSGVLADMQNDGFPEPGSSYVYDDGAYSSVDWTNSGILQNAISLGPVKLGVAADQIQAAWNTTAGRSGWFATGFHSDDNEDHCVALCGYGSISWLAQQLNCQVPVGVDGTKPGYAIYTWDSIGIIDVPSMVAVTQEAWLRKPTTIVRPTFPRVYGASFQANTSSLGINSDGTSSHWADTQLGMMAGTSPSIATLPGGGYVVAFQANTGALGINTNGQPSSWANTQLGMMAGTSPSITRA